MRIAFIQTYPIYHDLVSTEDWLARSGRHRWMPGIASDMGFEVELWGVDHSTSVHTSKLEGFGDYTIRLFESSKEGGQTKKHYSSALVEHARAFDADIHVLKGVDGGVGLRLLRKFLLPTNKPFVFIIGGKYYTRYVPKAKTVFYETELQRERLRSPGWRFWRGSLADEQLIRLPKSIDTDLFRPMPDIDPRWDIISVGRLISRYKSYDAVGKLSDQFRVAVVGGGPAEDKLRAQYPDVDWLGQVSHQDVPRFLNQGRVFMHTSLNDYFPRVIAEASACGLPCLAFAEAIDPDVIPPDCGLRLDSSGYLARIHALLGDPERLERMGTRARDHAAESFHKRSSRGPLEKMIQYFRQNVGVPSSNTAG